MFLLFKVLSVSYHAIRNGFVLWSLQMFADQQPISQLCILYLNQIVCNLLPLLALHSIFKDPYLYQFQIRIPLSISYFFSWCCPDCFTLQACSIPFTIFNFLQQKEGESALRLELIRSFCAKIKDCTTSNFSFPSEPLFVSVGCRLN